MKYSNDWDMDILRRYIGFECSLMLEMDAYDGNTYCEPAENPDLNADGYEDDSEVLAVFYSVFGVLPEGGRECLFDTPIESVAENATEAFNLLLEHKEQDNAK